MKKRLFRILLALCMVLCLMPTTAFAGDDMTASKIAEVSTAAELTSAIRETSYGTVKLMSDITIYTTLEVSRTVTLDLNGYVLKYGSSGAGQVITVSSGILTIENSDYTKSHKFTVDSSGLWVLDEENGTQSISGGIITGGHHPSSGGGVDMSSSGAAVIMNGGAIVGCQAGNSGGGVYAVNFTMNARARIVGCTAGKYGGGVLARGTFTMNYNSRISNCIAKEGAGVYEAQFFKGNFIMNGGVISTCNATKHGGGVYIGNSFTMARNASIVNCTVSDGGSGGALYVGNNRSVCTLNGGTIGGKNSEKYNRDSIVNNGTINGTMDRTNGTIYGKVINESTGTIASGNYRGTVQNNNGSITGGIFTTVSGKLIITFDPANGGEIFKQEVRWNINGERLTEPSPAPTKEGYTFAGWYYDNNGTNTKWDFGSDKAKYTTTLTAVFEVPVQTYEVKVSASPTEGGSVSGDGIYNENTAVTIAATANNNYRFVKWEENGSEVSTDASYPFTVTSNRSLVAVFEKIGDGSHTHATILVEKVDATCTTNGTKAYYICECGKKFSDATASVEITDDSTLVVPATGHSYGNWVTDTAATSTTDGTKHRDCTVCGYTESGTIPATGGGGGEHTHNWSAWTSNGDGTHSHSCTCNAVETENCSGTKATCTEKAKCIACGVEYGAINPDNHNGTKQWTETATTHEEKWTCCNAIIVASEAHEWTDGVCSTCGYTCLHEDTDRNHICDICGKTISNHEDTDNNHICDYCGKEISDHTGDNSDHTNDNSGHTGDNSTHTGDNSAHTGDNSDLALWVTLLFVSGSAVIGTTVVSRKKKYNR